VELFAEQLQKDIEALNEHKVEKTAMDEIKSQRSLSVSTPGNKDDMDTTDWVEVEDDDNSPPSKLIPTAPGHGPTGGEAGTSAAEDVEPISEAEHSHRPKNDKKRKRPSAQISLAAKWMPSENKSHDRLLSFTKAVAMQVANLGVDATDAQISSAKRSLRQDVSGGRFVLQVANTYLMARTA
jgi:hypothetical protein